MIMPHHDYTNALRRYFQLFYAPSTDETTLVMLLSLKLLLSFDMSNDFPFSLSFLPRSWLLFVGNNFIRLVGVQVCACLRSHVIAWELLPWSTVNQQAEIMVKCLMVLMVAFLMHNTLETWFYNLFFFFQFSQKSFVIFTCMYCRKLAWVCQPDRSGRVHVFTWCTFQFSLMVVMWYRRHACGTFTNKA